MWIDSPGKYLPQLLLPKWVWSPGATVAAPLSRQMQALNSDAPSWGCQLVWNLECGKWMVSVHFPGCWKNPTYWSICQAWMEENSWETSKWRDCCVDTPLGAQRHCWDCFLGNRRRGRAVLFPGSWEGWRGMVEERRTFRVLNAFLELPWRSDVHFFFQSKIVASDGSQWLVFCLQLPWGKDPFPNFCKKPHMVEPSR